jgi:indole-3-glycerol phosphate synthase
MTSILDSIVSETRARVAGSKSASRFTELEKMAERHTPRGFRRHLRDGGRRGPAIIAELKKASPSRGIIRENFPVVDLARQLEDAGAAALSVLTEEKHFKGSLNNLQIASRAVSLPCLRKDFIVDELQLLEARAYGADAALLIVAALSDAELRKLNRAAQTLGLEILCEVHDERELERALAAGFDMIGVNNRDLKTFEVSLQTSIRLCPRIPAGVLRIAESGVHSGADIARLHAIGYDAFLVGETFMREPDPGDALRKVLKEAAAAIPNMEAARS